MRHGEVSGVIDPAVWLGDDPGLALVTADQVAYQAARPCRCEQAGEPCENCNPREDV